MSEKVLGFKEKDARFPLQSCKYAHVEKDKLIPVVSLEEHQKILNAGKFLKLRVIELEIELKKRISLEWLEDECNKKIAEDRTWHPDNSWEKGNRDGRIEVLEELKAAAKKQAASEK